MFIVVTVYHILVAVSTYLAPPSKTLRKQILQPIGEEHIVLETVVGSFAGVPSVDLLCMVLIPFAVDFHDRLFPTTSYDPIFRL